MAFFIFSTKEFHSFNIFLFLSFFLILLRFVLTFFPTGTKKKSSDKKLRFESRVKRFSLLLMPFMSFQHEIKIRKCVKKSKSREAVQEPVRQGR